MRATGGAIGAAAGTNHPARASRSPRICRCQNEGSGGFQAAERRRRRSALLERAAKRNTELGRSASDLCELEAEKRLVVETQVPATPAVGDGGTPTHQRFENGQAP